jgi:hypothetical protein
MRRLRSSDSAITAARPVLPRETTGIRRQAAVRRTRHLGEQGQWWPAVVAQSRLPIGFTTRSVFRLVIAGSRPGIRPGTGSCCRGAARGSTVPSVLRSDRDRCVSALRSAARLPYLLLLGSENGAGQAGRKCSGSGKCVWGQCQNGSSKELPFEPTFSGIDANRGVGLPTLGACNAVQNSSRFAQLTIPQKTSVNGNMILCVLHSQLRHSCDDAGRTWKFKPCAGLASAIAPAWLRSALNFRTSPTGLSRRSCSP